MSRVPVRLADCIDDHNVESQPEVVKARTAFCIGDDELLSDRGLRAPLGVEGILFLPCPKALRHLNRNSSLRAELDHAPAATRQTGMNPGQKLFSERGEVVPHCRHRRPRGHWRSGGWDADSAGGDSCIGDDELLADGKLVRILDGVRRDNQRELFGIAVEFDGDLAEAVTRSYPILRHCNSHSWQPMR